MKFNWFAAAFAGFGLIGRRFGIFIAWTALSVLVLFMSIMTIRALGVPVNLVGPVTLGALLLISGVLVTAVHRALLDPDRATWGFIRLGLRELVSAVLLMLLGVLASLPLLAAGIAFSTFDPDMFLRGEVASWFALLGILAGSVAGPISLVGPAVSDNGWKGIGVGLRLAGGRLWKLTAMTSLAWIIGLVWVILLRGVVEALAVATAGFAGLLMAPVLLAWLVILVAPGGVAYRDVRQPAATPVEVFD